MDLHCTEIQISGQRRPLQSSHPRGSFLHCSPCDRKLCIAHFVKGSFLHCHTGLHSACQGKAMTKETPQKGKKEKGVRYQMEQGGGGTCTCLLELKRSQQDLHRGQACGQPSAALTSLQNSHTRPEPRKSQRSPCLPQGPACAVSFDTQDKHNPKTAKGQGAKVLGTSLHRTLKRSQQHCTGTRPFACPQPKKRHSTRTREVQVPVCTGFRPVACRQRI